MHANSRKVQSAQTGIHRNLSKTLQNHLRTIYQKPISEDSIQVFRVIEHLSTSVDLPVILDSGCGTGENTRRLAEENPDKLILGIDKSLRRLRRGGVRETVFHKKNLIFARMDLVDFYLLAHQNRWRLERHLLFYPNPWPKPRHLQRRWHAHPVFSSLLSLGGRLELRTNWRIYAEEFHYALSRTDMYKTEIHTLDVKTPRSSFEKKYLDSGHELSQCIGEPAV